MMELKDTVTMMNSEDYKERFKAEYYQTKIRYEKLKAFNNKIEAAERTEYMAIAVAMPTHDCPADLLREQQALMGQYLHILEVRAVIEGISLEDIDRRSIQQEELKDVIGVPYTPPSLFDYSKQTSTKEYNSTITCSKSPCCELAKEEVRID